MGFQRGTLNLVFADPQFDGLEVKARRASIGEISKLTQLANVDADSLTEDEQHTYVDKLCNALAKGVNSWNYEDEEDNPIPVTTQAMRDVDLVMLYSILDAWLRASTEVPSDVEKKLKPGNGQSNGTRKELAEVSLPMVIPEQSQ